MKMEVFKSLTKQYFEKSLKCNMKGKDSLKMSHLRFLKRSIFSGCRKT